MAVKEKVETALVTGKGAAGNPSLDRVVNSIQAGYKPHRIGKATRQFRIDHTAMIPNEKPIYAFKTVTNADGTTSQIPRLVFRAGWYLSAEEKYIADQLMKDPANKKLTESIWKEMEEANMAVEKEAAEITDAKVVS